MVRSSRIRGPHAPDRLDLYDQITHRIIAELEAGCVPWVRPWRSEGAGVSIGMPRNAGTRRPYSGINILILWDAAVRHGYAAQGWLTFRQALALGGCVRKGERGTTVVYADRFVPQKERERARESGGEPGAVAFLKRFTVFAVEQCENLPDDLISSAGPVPEGLILPEVEALVAASGADLRMGGDQAFYAPGADFIQVPRPEVFAQPINWHRTAVHELGHWTGHQSRLARDLSGSFGSPNYAREELVAEMCAAFTCATLGIVPTVRHADYIGSWLAVVREDNRAIVRAASAASKAADYLLAFRPGGAVTAREEIDAVVLEAA